MGVFILRYHPAKDHVQKSVHALRKEIYFISQILGGAFPGLGRLYSFRFYVIKSFGGQGRG
ncbi:MAG: hypothetical protein A2X89_00465 [Deltaproteobacteria bacterium GWD2_55_8]|nr:MAG: hypothetical protein A2X89_00465 [Deltaproteobacteria bacterium GWD2_55_8]